jgi:hypothetical protein
MLRTREAPPAPQSGSGLAIKAWGWRCATATWTCSRE